MSIAAVGDQRSRILDAALTLMGEQGAAGMSMRQLAAACGLNVATLYHYFPSKALLLRSVIEERRYGERLASDTPPVRRDLPPRERLTDLLTWLWASALDEELVWRLLIGEAMRGEEVATQTTADVVEALTDALAAWLADGFPELTTDLGATARVVRAQLFAMVVEHLAVGAVTPAEARRRAAELSAVLVR